MAAKSNKFLGTLMVLLGLLLIVVQIIGGVLFINFPAEHAMAGLWGGVFVIATGVAAIRERSALLNMSIACIVLGMLIAFLYGISCFFFFIFRFDEEFAAGETRDWLFAYLCTLFLRIVLGATVVAVNSALVNRSSRERSDAAPRDAYHLSLPAPASFH